jgi:hypothetical protein
MNADQNKYPVFEANQVLTNAHLNQVFNYLDEQDRLTRANLIGIGVVCGLDVSHNAAGPSVGITRGCGVTSEGYLILLPEDTTLVSYKPYILPNDLAYTPFTTQTGTPPISLQYPMWEMFPVGEPDALPLTDAFLANKVVVLFLELKKDGLRNCSPNNCDDRGEEVTVTVRKLLFNKIDLDKIIALANGLSAGLSANDLTAAFTAKINLPDLSLPRYDVPNTSPATSDDVLISFLEVFQKVNLAVSTGNALTAAYTAFKPLLEKDFPTNPFLGFNANFSFLDNAPANTAQVKFVQYYYDFFDDLLKAYNEFRWTGAELLCVCCPPDGLFPRHLMLGEVFPTANAVLYRHTFLSSPATCCSCEEETAELLLLFRRLVEMIERFTNNPPLSDIRTSSNLDGQIKITPSKLADVSLSDKCIPYYYTQNGTPPLFQLWNAVKTRRGRATQNLSYRANEYATADFVKRPLLYDLEPYNFLRIEGHLGKNYISVLQTLVALKNQNRLPIEIIALRTGIFDEKIAIDLSKEECTFQDLNSLYKTLREEMRCFFCKEMQYFYNLNSGIKSAKDEPFSPKVPLLVDCAPSFLVQPGTLGEFFENWYATNAQSPYGDPDALNLVAFINNLEGSTNNYLLIYIIYYIHYITLVLPEALEDLDCAELENRYLDLEKIAVALENYHEEAIPKLEGTANILTWEEIDDRIEAILFACKFDPIKALCMEYENRIREIKKKHFLSFFLQKNPGIQHKAGVPMGGTFIIVYHDDPDPLRPPFNDSFQITGLTTNINRVNLGTQNTRALSSAITNIQKNPAFINNPDFQALFVGLTGQTLNATFTSGKGNTDEEVQKIVAETVAGFTDGTVIADFYLPYICCSDCAPVQYVLPRPPLGFALTLGCTTRDNISTAVITPQGGVAPFTVQIDAQPAQPLVSTVQLTVGPHTLIIRDSEGSESAPQTVNVPAPLVIVAPTFIDNPADGTYQVTFTITGGQAPYTPIDGVGTINGNVFLSAPVSSGKTIPVSIGDSAGCKTSEEFTHEVPAGCDLPCDGIAKRCGYRFWIPVSTENAPYKAYKAKVPEFSFETPQGGVNLASEIENIIQSTNGPLNTNFESVVKIWLEKINDLIANKVGSTDYLKLEYTQAFTDTFGTLWIEYFECLKFNFTIDSQFLKPNTPERIGTEYDNSGTKVIVTSVTGGQTTASFPAFNCTIIDKCSPNRPIKNICEKLNIRLGIDQKIDKKSITLSPKTEEKVELTQFFWEVEDATPPFSNEKSATFTFEKNQKGVKNIRLTAFTKEGCKVEATSRIDVPEGDSNPTNPTGGGIGGGIGGGVVVGGGTVVTGGGRNRKTNKPK